MKWLKSVALVVFILFNIVGEPAFAQSKGSRASQLDQIDLKQAPAEFKSRLAATEKEMKEMGGFVVAGKVEIDKAAPPKPGEYAVALRFDKSNAEDTYKHPGGWFISRVIPKDKIYKTALVVATFRELPAEAALTLDEGKVNWAIATLQKTTAREQALISGTVIDELGEPVAKAKVSLHLSRSNGTFANESTGLLLTQTDAKGKYAFVGVTFQEYEVTVNRENYSGEYAVLTTPKTANDSTAELGQNTNSKEPRPLIMTRIFAKQGKPQSESNTAILILGFLRTITIDYEYSLGNYFTGDVVKKGIIWRDNLYDSTPIKFSTGSLARGQQDDDLWLINKEGGLFFRHFYHSLQKNGHYDLGEIPFDSVSKIDEAKARKSRNDHTPCVLNHVYGVKTYDGKFAKFVVRKIELQSVLDKTSGSQRKRP